MDLFFDQEFRTIIPPLTAVEYTQLENSLKVEGNREPIVVWKETNLVLDGHNRYDICHKHNIKLKEPLRLSFSDRDTAAIWIINNQLSRRNLTPYQRSALELRREEIIKAQSKAKEHERKSTLQNSVESTSQTTDTQKELAKAAKVSHDTIWKVKQVEERAPEIIKEQARKGDISVNQAYTELKVLESLPEGLRSQAVALVETKQVKNFYEARKTVHREEANKIEPPVGKYQVLYADPPWDYNHGTDSHGRADKHYSVMSLEKICSLPIDDLADDNAVLFLWVTAPMLEKAFSVVHAWGFEYKTFFVWDKVKHVMGHYSSVRHEVLFLCTKGVYPKQSKTLRDSVISIERSGNHSEKPEEFRQLIEELYPHGNKIELFPRGQTTPPGWERWGYQD